MKTVKKKNEKKVIRKEYIPIIIAVLLLIIMVIVLFIVLSYDGEYGLILPDAPTEKNLNIEIYDFDSAKYDPNDLTEKEIKNSEVNYLFVTDYYKQGIRLSNTNVDYTDDEFIIYSGQYGDTPYVSVVDLKGKLKWINKLDKSGYDTLKIKKILKADDYYYVFANGNNNNSIDGIALKINSKGNVEKREIISEKSRNSISEVTRTDNGFAVTTDGDEGLMIYLLNDDFKLQKNPYNILNDKNNIFHTYNPYVMSLDYKDKVVTAIVQYNGLQNEKMYLVNYNVNTNTSSITPFTEIMKLANPYTSSIQTFKNKFLVGHDKRVYMFDKDGKIVKNYDYSSLKLKEDDLQSDTGEVINNYISVDGIKLYDDNILVRNITNSDYIYDVFDKDLNLKMRYVLNVDEEYETKENVLLDVFYIDGKLYEVHSYGYETPSIMISVIG